jgi:hypothetical protein
MSRAIVYNDETGEWVNFEDVSTVTMTTEEGYLSEITLMHNMKHRRLLSKLPPEELRKRSEDIPLL